MESWQKLRLFDRLTVWQAARFLADTDPSVVRDPLAEDTLEEIALKRAIVDGSLAATLVGDQDSFELGHPETDWTLTTVSVDALKAWAQSRGIKASCFEAESKKPNTVKQEARYRQEILESLVWNNFNPKALPPRIQGLASPPKQIAKHEMLEVYKVMSDSQFEKAWLALLTDREIVQAVQLKGRKT